MPASTSNHWSLFDTVIGPCAVAWGARGIVGIRLPSETPDETATSLGPVACKPSTEPTPQIRHAIDRISALLAGEDPDLGEITIDLSRLTDFDRRVLDLTRAIPRGRTRTYGAIAIELGDPLLARDVGRALAHNPIPIVVPCHRVVGADEKLVGFSAPGGLVTKRRLLATEGVFPGGKTLFDHFEVDPDRS